MKITQFQRTKKKIVISYGDNERFVVLSDAIVKRLISE